jgi:hypothetical protein
MYYDCRVAGTGRMTPQRRAIVCLIAVAMLYAPVVSAAVAACLMPCCTADDCEIAAHHHKPMKPVPRHECPGQDSAQDACAMRACPTGQQQQTVASHIFVLPAGTMVVASVSLPHKRVQVSSAAPQALPEPPSPPPRLFLS